MRSRLLAAGAALVGAALAQGTVFINEVFINPPGSLDDTREFFELYGTPGKKLDGYAIAVLNGTQQKYYPLGSITPGSVPIVIPEIDEIYVLDGLSLGANGLLLIGNGNASNYPNLLPDTNFAQTFSLYNGPYDTPGNIQNDGSNTIVLVRNRPGGKSVGDSDWRWAKDVKHDYELITPAVDPQTMLNVDQFGDGDCDDGGPDGLGGAQFDMRGRPTASILDDLEIVDEVSYEHDRGWEYDFDSRRVDIGSTDAFFPERRVHALDDPEGYNPDALTRVDYRTRGPGWPPQPGSSGDGPGGNNWQDTATEQWIRGDTVQGTVGGEPNPQFFYSNAANPANTPQPWLTNVPKWLNDGVAPDYNFTASNTYRLMSGRINPLAIPFIPGDVNRDGVCDDDDIAKLAAVFGDDDWIFSNSWPTAAETNSGDPASQTRPWDVDATGDNGIECSDLQWVLNFRGNTNGQVIGRTYESAVPAAAGVTLNSNAGVICTLSTASTVTGGRPLSGVFVGDTIELLVRGQVTGGANTLAGQQNGIMQFVHDVAVSSGGVVRVTSVAPAAGFTTTRAALEALQGVSGDLGIDRVNGHSTSFVNGLGGAADLYVVTLDALAPGTANLSVAPSSTAKFTASTPLGLKVGHTLSHGDPAAVAYPAPIAITVVAGCLRGDANCDGSVNNFDIDPFVIGLLNVADPTPPPGYSAGADCWAQRACWGDVSGDSLFNNFDIDPFVACIVSSPAPGQPCP
ncbi:MAG: hypothetical protein HRU75_14465 [Planctomycetia bacterium]|nr:MAG: hypothetical protein HRU75_14465 [Planctomycetia bacterium]